VETLKIEFELNGKAVAPEVGPGETLLDLVRRLGQKSVKRSCETGNCGACTVLLDGRPVASCIVLAAQAHGSKVTTIEGLAGDEVVRALQDAFVEAGAPQCGFCTPGMLLTLASLIRDNPASGRISRMDLRRAIAGNICRCSGYVKILDAAEAAISRLRAGRKTGKTIS
jgi:carbon-monoxide dehydrogenase small subunit